MTRISQKPLGVGIVTRSLMMGGAQNQIVKLCQTISPERAQIVLYLLCRDEPQDLASAVPKHVRIKTSPFRRHHPRALKWLANEFQSEKIEVVHSFLWTADVFTAFSKRIFQWRARLIGSERGDRGIGVYRGFRNYLDRVITFSTANAFCANSHFGARLLESAGCTSLKLKVIHNGVDLGRIDALAPAHVRQQFGWSKQDFVLGAVSRLIDYKGVDILIRAVGLLQSSIPLKCVLVGDGPQRAELEELVKRLQLEKRVVFLGTQLNGSRFVKEFDVALLTTRADTEHCSNSILEYMACAKPVIATAVAGNPELVVDGATGLLVKRDDPEALAQAIKELYLNKPRLQQMGCAGRRRVEQEFQMALVADRFVELWQAQAARG